MLLLNYKYLFIYIYIYIDRERKKKILYILYSLCSIVQRIMLSCPPEKNEIAKGLYAILVVSRWESIYIEYH